MTRLLLILCLCASLRAQDDFIPFFYPPGGGAGNHLVPDAIVFLKMDESSGGASDASGNGRTFTESGSVGAGSGIVNGGRIFVKSDETDYLYRTSDSAFGFSGDFTITAWINVDTDPPDTDDMAILSMGDFSGGTANFSFTLEFDSGTPVDYIAFYWSTDGNFDFGNRVEFSFGSDISGTSGWYFVVARRTGTTLHLSATLASESTLATDATGTVSGALYYASGDEVRVGDLEGSDLNDMNGSIDELGVWNRYLSDCEIAKLFTARAGSFTWPSFDSLTCAP